MTVYGEPALGRVREQFFLPIPYGLLSNSFTLAAQFCYGVSVAERARDASLQRLL